MCKLGSLKDEKPLMRTGLGLIIIGHGKFILGAIVHGAVLRHVTRPNETQTIRYAVANVIAVVSGLVCISAGIAAIILSRDLKRKRLKWALLVLSMISFLLSAACVVGLTLALVSTIMDNGRGLLAHCNSSSPSGQPKAARNCSFDPTRIYETTIALWIPLILMAAIESLMSLRCIMASCSLLELPPCRRRKGKVRFSEQTPKEITPREPGEHRGLLTLNDTPVV
ncbi:keratinocyte-associated protein 3-like [Polypterus senegalus]|uniref:keratinocyte-associated protein 3-like n=1 Tax=Polypterus senegalus TaxID=55291 RepID=UPI001966A937|nr:keratinocyte-associated protein 3-like [Polypterus senegalus]